jgi:hypothetical protein
VFEARSVDPVPPLIEVIFRLPAGVGPGLHRLELGVGSRGFPGVMIEVV